MTLKCQECKSTAWIKILSFMDGIFLRTLYQCNNCKRIIEMEEPTGEGSI